MDLKIQPKPTKHKEVILLVDNRKDKQNFNKSNHIDFRNSAFKQTQVDPLESRPDIYSLNLEDTILLNLKRKVSELQRRVLNLESQNNMEMNSSKTPQGQAKKKRRKFSELSRNFKCSHEECGKIYGSETSLKNHLKLKHSQQKAPI